MGAYSMTDELWSSRVSGSDCPFCEPREDDGKFWIKISKLSASTLYLSRDQRYFGRCLLISDGPHQVGISSLSAERAHAMFEDLRRAGIAIEKAVKCELLNLASLGNQIAHLHWHLIPRFKDDLRWGAPPWTTGTHDVPAKALPEQELRALGELIASELANAALVS